MNAARHGLAAIAPTILVRSLKVDVPNGGVGDARGRIAVEIAGGMGGLGRVAVGGPIGLDLTFDARTGPADFAVGDIHSATGPVDVRVHDVRVGAGHATAGATWHLGEIDSGASDVVLDFGDDRGMVNDVVVNGPIRAHAGRAVVRTVGGAIRSGDAAGLIDAAGITLDATSVGTHAAPIAIAMTATGGVLDGVAAGGPGFFARSIGGPIRVGDVRAGGVGDVELTAIDTAATNDDIRLATETARVAAPGGSVTILAGDDFLLAPGASIRARGAVVIGGDAGDADPGVGAIIEVDGDVAGSRMIVNGGPDGDAIAVRNVAPGMSARINAGLGDDAIDLGSAATAMPDPTGGPAPTRNGGDLRGILGAVIVDAGGGRDRLAIEADGDPVGRAVTIDATTVGGLTGGHLADRTGPGYGYSPVTYLNIEALDILLGLGDDSARVDGLSPATATTIDGGTGDDTFRVGAIGVPARGVALPMFVGGAGSNTVEGPDSVNPWEIVGIDGGVVGGPNAFRFASVRNLKGGRLADTFAFDDGASLTGRVDGGLGVNALDYSLYTAPVVVDLPAGRATGVAGGVTNIATAIGPRKS